MGSLLHLELMIYFVQVSIIKTALKHMGPAVTHSLVVWRDIVYFLLINYKFHNRSLLTGSVPFT